MSRPPRIEVANGIYHVVARGNERRLIFVDDIDRERFLELLGGVAERYRWLVLSYCLMGNHYHVLVQTIGPNLARGMRQLNGVYAQWFNRRHVRVGHLFEGRYKAVLVQEGEHFERALRYVVRNPVRAGLTLCVHEWRWTSHGAMVGAAREGVVPVVEVLRLLGPDPRSARRRYVTIVSTEADPPAAPHPLIEGDDSFVGAQLSRVAACPEYPLASVEQRRPPLSDLVSSRDDIAALFHAYAQHGYSMRQIATHLRCGVTTIHRRVRAHEADLRAGDLLRSERNMEDLTPVGSPRLDPASGRNMEDLTPVWLDGHRRWTYRRRDAGQS